MEGINTFKITLILIMLSNSPTKKVLIIYSKRKNTFLHWHWTIPGT